MYLKNKNLEELEAFIHVYTNLKTGETIKSTDGNKLDELNSKKKAKREKSAGVPMSAMTFKF